MLIGIQNNLMITHGRRMVQVIIQQLRIILSINLLIIPIILGQEFVLRFILNEDSIIVYTGDYPSSIFEYEFKLQYDISTITNIQVWDDVERVDELVFRYKN